MMVDIPEIEIEIFGIYDRGVPNKERIVLRTYSETNLSHYFLLLGFTDKDSSVIFPIKDHFLWLGNTLVEKDSWVFVYTGPGMTKVTREINTNDPVHNIYWNKTKVILDDKDLMPALSSFGRLLIAKSINKDISEINNSISDLIQKKGLSERLK